MSRDPPSDLVRSLDFVNRVAKATPLASLSGSDESDESDVLTTRVADGIAVITLGNATRSAPNLFLKSCISEPALARMRSYEEKKITSPSRSIEV